MSRLLPLLMISLWVPIACTKKITTITSTPVVIREFNFETLQAKAQLSYGQGEQPAQKVNANIRIKQNHTIWISFSVFGILGGRVLINKDSITLLNSMNKSYTILDYPTLSQQLDFKIDYTLLQALLLGNPLQPLSAADQVRTITDYMVLQQQRENLDIINQINVQKRKIEQTKLYNHKSGSSLTVTYSDFQDIENQSFPKNTHINLIHQTKNRTETYTITLKYSTLKLNNDELKFPFRIPQKYDRR